MQRNKKLTKCPVKVMELNFLKEFSEEMQKELQKVEIVIAADGKLNPN